MIEDALRYPTTAEDSTETILLGGVFALLSWLVVPMLLVYGYVVLVIRETALAEGGGNDETVGPPETPPSFDEWGELLVDGLKVLVVGLVYAVVPSILFLVGVFALLVPVLATDGSGGAGALFVFGVLALMLVMTLLQLALLYVLPAAVAAMAMTDRLGAAFSFGTVRQIATSEGYLTGWAVALAVQILGNIVAVAAMATFVGIVLLPFISFYVYVAGGYAIGRGVRGVDLNAA